MASVATLAFGAEAQGLDWSATALAAHEQWLSPDLGGHGWVLLDARGRGLTRGGGDLHLFLNTETLQAGVEDVPLGTPELRFSAAVRAEGAYAGVLPDYRALGARQPGRGFWASYAWAFASIKWLPGGAHSLELVAAARRWLFARSDATSRDLLLPPNATVFEPRLRYTYWAITSPAEEWQAHIAYPRLRGIAVGVELGLGVAGVIARPHPFERERPRLPEPPNSTPLRPLRPCGSCFVTAAGEGSARRVPDATDPTPQRPSHDPEEGGLPGCGRRDLSACSQASG